MKKVIKFISSLFIGMVIGVGVGYMMLGEVAMDIALMNKVEELARKK